MFFEKMKNEPQQQLQVLGLISRTAELIRNSAH